MSRLLVLAVALLASGASAQTMYKCVDSRGVTRYSDQPQPGCKGREVNIRGQPPISDTPPSRREEPDEEERDEQRRNKAQAERIREAQRNTAAMNQRQCAQMQAEIDHMESGRRIIRLDDKGEPSFVEDAERERRAAQLREEMRQKCR